MNNLNCKFTPDKMELSEDTFIELFTAFLSSDNENKEQVCGEIGELLKIPDSMSILLNLIKNPNESIGKCASVFLTKAVELNDETINDSTASEIFQNLLQIYATSDYYVANQLFKVLDILSRKFDSGELVQSIIQQLFESNKLFYALCMCLITSFNLLENIDLVLALIEKTLSSDDINIVNACVCVTGFVLSHEIDEDKRALLVEAASARFISVISSKNEEFVNAFHGMIYNGFLHHYRTIPLESVLPTLQEVICGDFPPKIKYYSMLILYYLFEMDDCEMSDEDVTSLLDQTIECSISLYDESLEYSEQLIDGGEQLMVKLLRKFSFDDAKEYVMQRISDLCEVNEEPQYYFVVILMSIGYERSKKIFNGNYANIFQILFSILNECNDILKSSVVDFLEELYNGIDINEVQKEEIPFTDYIQQILSLASESEFIDALKVVPLLILTMESSDEIFQTVLGEEMALLSDDQPFIFYCTFNTLFSLISKSKSYVRDNFSVLVEMLRHYIENEEKAGMLPYILNCIRCILNVCPDLMMQEMEFLLDSIFKGLESENCDDFAHGADLLLTVVKLDESILHEIHENVIEAVFSHEIANAAARFAVGEVDLLYVKSFVMPSFNILTALVRNVSEISENEELIGKLFELVKDDIENGSETLFVGNAAKLYSELVLHKPDNELVIPLRDILIDFIIRNPFAFEVAFSLTRIIFNLGLEFLNNSEDRIIESLIIYADSKVNKETNDSEVSSEFAQYGSRLINTIIMKKPVEKVAEFIGAFSETLLRISSRNDFSEVFGLTVINCLIPNEAFPGELVQPIVEICSQVMDAPCLTVLRSLLSKYNEIANDLSQFVFQYFIDNHEALTPFNHDNLISIICTICLINNDFYGVDELHSLVLSSFPIVSDFECNEQAMQYLFVMQGHMKEENIPLYCQAIARSYAKPLNYLPALMIPDEYTPALIGYLLQVSQANGGTQFLLSLLENNQIVCNNLLHVIASLHS